MDIIISQTLIKKFLYHGEFVSEEGELYYCPLKNKTVYIDQEMEEGTTESQLYGKYAETKMLGSGRGGEKVEDLPRKKIRKKELVEENMLLKKMGKPPKHIGEKTIDHERIDEQVENFHYNVIKKHRMIIIPGQNTQVVVRKQIDPSNLIRTNKDDIKAFVEKHNIYVEGNLDIYPTPIYWEGHLFENACVDLKITQNMYSKFGDFSWGRPDTMDHTQAQMYSLLTANPFFYLVMDYSKHLNWDIMLYEINDIRMNELYEKIRKTLERIVYHSYFGWEPDPEYYRCKPCPLNHINGGDCYASKNSRVI